MSRHRAAPVGACPVVPKLFRIAQQRQDRPRPHGPQPKGCWPQAGERQPPVHESAVCVAYKPSLLHKTR